MRYNKLVRDNIPAIVAGQGLEAVTRILSDEEFAQALEEKLEEEVQEYRNDKTPEELADILEVVYALAGRSGLTQAALEKLRAKKAAVRGAFSEKVFLIETKEL